jgi:hypothetical protein
VIPVSRLLLLPPPPPQEVTARDSAESVATHIIRFLNFILSIPFFLGISKSYPKPNEKDSRIGNIYPIQDFCQ